MDPLGEEGEPPTGAASEALPTLHLTVTIFIFCFPPSLTYSLPGGHPPEGLLCPVIHPVRVGDMGRRKKSICGISTSYRCTSLQQTGGHSGQSWYSCSNNPPPVSFMKEASLYKTNKQIWDLDRERGSFSQILTSPPSWLRWVC